MPSVHFYYADINPLSITKKKLIKDFIKHVFSNEGKSLSSLNYIFCSDLYLLEINKNFLEHDYFTDIISFDLSEGEEVIGEIYISVDRVRENGALHSSSFKKELLRVLFHGALHLCGYKDKKKSEITIMRRKEDYYLQLFDQILD